MKVKSSEQILIDSSVLNEISILEFSELEKSRILNLMEKVAFAYYKEGYKDGKES